MTMPSRAMVLAAGLGVRMRPLTDDRPKPMIAVAGRTMIDRALDHLAECGIAQAVVNTSYKAEMLEAHLARRTSPQMVISREGEPPLETGGGIKKALKLLGENPFFAINGDVVYLDGVTPALTRLAAAWDDARMDALLLLHPAFRAIGYEGRGDFFLLPGGEVARRTGAQVAPYVFTGIQLLHPRLFDGAPEGAFSLNLLYDKSKDERGVLTRVHALVHDGEWLHIGDPRGLKAAENFLAQIS